MPVCPYCNESNPSDVGICKKCGGTIPREEPAGEGLSQLDKEILALMQSGKKIEAIKIYRQKTGRDLKAAKDAVEALAAKHGIETKGAGCAGVLLFAMLVPLAWRILG